MARYRKSGFGRILAVVLALALAVGGGFALYRWLKPSAPEVQTGAVIDDQGNDLTQGAHQIPKGMTFLAANTAGITLTATVTPADADDKAILWTFAWADPADPWIANAHAVLTDYLTVTPDAENSGRAVVTCPRAFGAKIKLTAAAKANPALMYECTVDYAKRILDVTYKLVGRELHDEIIVYEPEELESKAVLSLSRSACYDITPNIRWSAGTIQPELIQQDIITYISPKFVEYLAEFGAVVPDVKRRDGVIMAEYDSIFVRYEVDHLFHETNSLHNAFTRYFRAQEKPFIYICMDLRTIYERVPQAETRCNLFLSDPALDIVPESVTVDSGAIVL